MNSSYFSMRARSPRMIRMSWGLKRSEHSGQQMLTRDSEISMRRYWRRQSAQERWWQVMMSGKRSRAWRSRHRGHSNCSDEEPDAEDVDATPSAEWAEVLSCKASGWTHSVLTVPSTAAAACTGLDLRLGSRSGRRRRPKSEWRDRRRFLGVFLTEGRLTEEATEWRSRSEPVLPWCCWCRLIIMPEGAPLVLRPEITTLGEETRDGEREEYGEMDWGLRDRMVGGGGWASVS